MGQARASSLALRRGARTELWVDDSLYVVAATSEGGEVVVVALHTGWEERSESVPFQDLGLDGVSLTDLIEPTRSVTGADGVLPITLPSWGYALFATAP